MSMALVRQSASALAAQQDSVVERLVEQMLHRHARRPAPGEVKSWDRSVPILVQELLEAGLGSVEVMLEHQLPLTSKRIDALLAGFHPVTGAPSYVVVELKQWSEAALFEDQPELVELGAYGHRPVLHPMSQVEGYCEYLLDFIPGLAAQRDAVRGVAFLHNATAFGVAPLWERGPSRFGPLITGDRRAELHAFLRSRFAADQPGAKAADDLQAMRVGPSRQLLAVAAEEIKNREQFTLIAEQREAYLSVLHAVERARQGDRKRVIVVSGGPGSGKSVIALSLLGELARQERSVVHATGSRSFTQTMRSVAGRGSTRVKGLFKYFNQFMEAEKNGLDVLICDEAHRIRETSVDRYTKAYLRTGRPQVDELIDAARVPVFLLDEHQVVRPGEMGSVEQITRYAERMGHDVLTVSLDEQFRCGGSEAYLAWVQRLLGLVEGGPVPWEGDPQFQVRVVDSPEEMTAALKAETSKGYGARMTAGYCWPWSNPRNDGSLVDDVVIGSWSRPWNLKGDRSVGGAPPAALWASDPAGFGQVGCVYTAQGFEYDWNGVILGPDLVWRGGRWVSRRAENRDPDFRSTKRVSDSEFDALVRNVYKVLLTRGMVGTLIYSTDEETRSFLRSLVG
ncbi:MAG: DNA/RNA helicase domain-containing protein [Motilibacteraceae bacterium]